MLIDMIYPNIYRITIVFKDKTQIIKEASGLTLMWNGGFAGYATSDYDSTLFNIDTIDSIKREVLTWHTIKAK